LELLVLGLGGVGVGATEDDGRGEDFLPNGLVKANLEDDDPTELLGIFLSIDSTAPSSFSTSTVKCPDSGSGVVVPLPLPLPFAPFLKLNFIVHCLFTGGNRYLGRLQVQNSKRNQQLPLTFTLLVIARPVFMSNFCSSFRCCCFVCTTLRSSFYIRAQLV
jgi:hypothetical protein